MNPALRTKLLRVGAVALSTSFMVLCCPDYDLWWLGFVAWVPLFAAMERVRHRHAFYVGWAVGTFTVLWGFSWLSYLLTKFAGLPLIAAIAVALLFSAWHGLIWGLGALAVSFARQRAPTAPIWLTAPLAWIAAEAFLPNIFPIYMALGWCWQPLWIQSAEIGGVTMVTGTMVAINAALYAAMHHAWNTRRIEARAVAVALALLTLTPLYGAWRIAAVEAEMEAAPKLKMGVVQGNMSIREMGTPSQRPRILAGLQSKSAELEAQGADVVVWGETSYPNASVFVRDSVREPPPGNPWRIHEGFSIPAIVGVVTRERTDRQLLWNTAILLDEDGRLVSSYDKVFRLVFGEYVPLVDPMWYLEKVPHASYIQKGDGPSIMEFNGFRLAPIICYEDILPRYVWAATQHDPQVFVNLTNDQWFGDTHEPAEHLGLAVFRTVEQRRALVRSVNTGVSAYVDPTGRTVLRTDVTDPDVEGPQEPDGFIAEVPMMDPKMRTLYGHTGELFNVLCLLLLASLLVAGPRFSG